MDNTVWVALIAAAGVVVGAFLGYIGAKRTSNVSLKIAQEQLRAQHRVTDQAVTAIRSLLTQAQWELRSFDAIRNHVRGFEDDELRKLLVSCGAIAFQEKGSRKEMWGLLDRNSSRLGPTETPKRVEVMSTQFLVR